jgi:hypothetical protein
VIIYLLEPGRTDTCDFELAEKGSIVKCGEVALAKTGAKCLCREHAIYAMSLLNLYPQKAKGNKAFITNQEFIALMDARLKL